MIPPRPCGDRGVAARAQITFYQSLWRWRLRQAAARSPLAEEALEYNSKNIIQHARGHTIMHREITRRQLLTTAAGVAGGAAVAARDLLAAAPLAGRSPQAGPGADAPMFVPFPDIKWERIPPIPGRPAAKPEDPWPEIAILRVAPVTKATELMIRVPKNFHVPPHWHTANETHTIVSGTFIMACEGQKAELGPGSFNYMPAKMVHEAWTKSNDGALLFITVDAAWDVNFVEAK